MAEKSEHRKALEARAKAVGHEFHHSLGDEKLEAQVIAAEAAQAAPSNGATTAAKPDTSVAPKTDSETVTVVGPKKGRRRAGRQFGAEPVVIAIADLSQGELEAITSDPTLLVG